MLASDVVSLVEIGGLSALSKSFAISRREAESLHLRAQRVLALGANPLMTSDAAGTVRAAQRLTEPPAATDAVSPIDELEDAARAHARRIRAESSGLQLDSIGKLRGRVKLLERNVAHGYHDWSYDLKLSKRTLEILDGVS
jgi:hypothetical protein